MRRHALLLLALLLWPLAVLAPVVALAEGPASLGPLAPHVDLAPEGKPWRVAEQGGALLVENRSAAGDVRYWFVEPRDRPLKLSTTVRAETVQGAEGPSGAGLLYGLERQGSTLAYLAFVLDPGGTMALYRRGAKGFERLAQLRPRTPPGNRPMTLGIKETAAGIELLVEGQRIGALKLEGQDRGGVGLIAFGTGRFTFEGFDLAAAGRE